MVRVVYEIGYGSIPIRGVSTIESKLVALSGNGTTGNLPNLLVLLNTFSAGSMIKIQDDAKFNTKHEIGNGDSYLMFLD